MQEWNIILLFAEFSTAKCLIYLVHNMKMTQYFCWKQFWEIIPEKKNYRWKVPMDSCMCNALLVVFNRLYTRTTRGWPSRRVLAQCQPVVYPDQKTPSYWTIWWTHVNQETKWWGYDCIYVFGVIFGFKDFLKKFSCRFFEKRSEITVSFGNFIIWNYKVIFAKEENNYLIGVKKC